MKNGTQIKAAMIPTGRIIGDKMVRAAKLATAHPLQAAGGVH
jgi:hypothetical protein